MTSPFDNTDKAFDVFYSEAVVVTHKGERQTLEVNIFTDATADPLDDSAMDTDREDILLVFNRKDWGYVSKLGRGDTVERTANNGVAYKVSSARHDAVMGWVVRARSC